MNSLIFDVKYVIASLNPDAWYWMYQLDEDFKIYASSPKGIREYNRFHTEIIKNKTCTTYRLFGNLHREDGPAYISNGYQAWYYNGKRHCQDGPAIIYPSGKQ